MPRKAMGWTGVCLLQGFCPFCFKGRIGKASSKRVPLSSRHIDEVQALHAKRGNGLCTLDLKSPGDFCENPSLCKLVCLVCGKATVDGDDPAFEVFQNACCDGVDESDRPSRYEVEDAMDEHELVWTEQWETPVHAHCTKKAPCKCVVPLGATTCPTHKRSLVVRTHVPPKIQKMPPPVATSQRVGAGKVVLETATWLKKPSLMSTTYVSGGPAQTTRPGKKPQPKKPNVKLEAAAEKNCSYKINSWAVSKMSDPTAGEYRPKTGWKFDFKKHQDEYDPYNPDHGYREVNGVWMYRFPDGRLVRAGTVNEITPDGELIPLCF